MVRAGSEHLDPAYVDRYDAKAGVAAAGELALLRRFGLTETTTLVDLGSGTGATVLAVAPHCRRAVAVDVSPAMLARLAALVEAAGLRNVELVAAGFLSYEHAGEPPQIVHSRHALHHLPDFWKALALERCAALLPAGGTLVLRDLVYSFDPAEAGAAVEAWLAAAPVDERDGWTRPELEEHVRGEHSTFSWLLEPMLERAGFEIVEIEHAASRTHSRYVCVKR